MGAFDFINNEAEEKEKNFVAPLVEYQVEAYQIVRLRKQVVGNKVVREVVDTIRPLHGNSEIAKRKAISKAEIIGEDCFVVEKCERIVSMGKSETEEGHQYEN